MDQRAIFEALRLKIKLSKLILGGKSETVTKEIIAETVKDYGDLLIEFKHTGESVEFKTTIIDMCSSIIVMLENFCNEEEKEKKFYSIFNKDFPLPRDLPRFPNGGMVGPIYGPGRGGFIPPFDQDSLFTLLNKTGSINFDRKSTVSEIEKQLTETKNGKDTGIDKK